MLEKSLEELLTDEANSDKDVIEVINHLLINGKSNFLYIYLKLNSISVDESILLGSKNEALNRIDDALYNYLKYLKNNKYPKNLPNNFLNEFIAISRLGLSIKSDNQKIVNESFKYLQLYNQYPHSKTSLNARSIKKYIYYYQDIIKEYDTCRFSRNNDKSIDNDRFIGLTCAYFPLVGTFFNLYCDLISDILKSGFLFKIFISEDALYKNNFSGFSEDSNYFDRLVKAISVKINVDKNIIQKNIILDKAEKDTGDISKAWIGRNINLLNQCFYMIDLYGFYSGFAYVALSYKLKIPVLLYKTEAKHSILLPYDMATSFSFKGISNTIIISRHHKISLEHNVEQLNSKILERNNKLKHQPTILTAIRNLESRATEEDILMIYNALLLHPQLNWILAGVNDINVLKTMCGGLLFKFIENKRIVIHRNISDLQEFLTTKVYIYIGFKETGSSAVISWALSEGIPTLAYSECDCATLLSSSGGWSLHKEVLYELSLLLKSGDYYVEHCKEAYNLLVQHNELKTNQVTSFWAAAEAVYIRNLQSS